jgi:hypothetical protein
MLSTKHTTMMPHTGIADRLGYACVNGCVQALVADMVHQQRQQADSWRLQNELDQRADMQQLEGLMLQVRA